MKGLTQKEYDVLPGNATAELLNDVGSDGQPIIKLAQCEFKSGGKGIVKYWIDVNEQWYYRAILFIPNIPI